MAFGAKEFDLTVGESVVHVITFGSGEKDLIMLQGLTIKEFRGAGAMVALGYKKFAKDYRVVLFDRPDPLPEECTISALTQSVASAMDQMKIKNADVFGTSQGGMIALQLAIDRPDLIRRLVLAVTGPKATPMTEAALDKWIGFAEKNDWQGLGIDILESMYSERYQKRYRRFFPLILKTQKLISAERFISLARSIKGFDVTDRLGEIRCETLVLGGKEDKIVSPEGSYEIAKALGCEIHMYDGLGHAAYEEAPDFNDRILAFLRKVPEE